MGISIPAARNPFEVALEDIVVEKELCQRTGGAIVGLALQHFDIGGDVRAFGVFFGIGRDGNIEIAHFPQASDQFSSIGIASRMGNIGRPHTALRIAAKGNEATDAGSQELLGNMAHFVLRRTDAGNVRRRRQRRLGDKPTYCRQRRCPRGTAGAVRDRNEIGIPGG